MKITDIWQGVLYHRATALCGSRAGRKRGSKSRKDRQPRARARIAMRYSEMLPAAVFKL